VFAPTDVTRVLALAGSERDHEFARLWTVAEACAKAIGEGLRLLLRRLDPIGDADEGAWSGGPLTWAVAEPTRGYVCAIASDVPVIPSDITELVEVPFDWIAGSAPRCVRPPITHTPGHPPHQ
jgi:phosphopantetheinyl transferase